MYVTIYVGSSVRGGGVSAAGPRKLLSRGTVIIRTPSLTLSYCHDIRYEERKESTNPLETYPEPQDDNNNYRLGRFPYAPLPNAPPVVLPYAPVLNPW